MMSLDELLKIEGVLVAFEFRADGELVDYRSNNNTGQEMAITMPRYCATVTMNFRTLANGFTLTSEMNWLPQRGWSYSSPQWTVMIGNGGYRGAFVQTEKADLNHLSNVLAG
jgi:roadblock/LC7 domain-containing protein